MKKIINSLLSICTALSIVAVPASAQQVSQATKDSARQWVEQHRTPIDIGNYPSFKQSMMPSLNSMAAAQVVGLGEGTHGTSEFQHVRTWVTRYLCEEKGFTVIAFENSYGWCVELNKYLQTGAGNLDTMMRQNLLGMWQNTEIKELLLWMRQYNQTHRHKLQLAGMDYSETSTNVRIIQNIINKLKNPALTSLTDTLLARAQFMDVAYADMNNAKRTYQWSAVLDNGVKAYEVTKRIKATLDSLNRQLHRQLSGAAIKTLYTTLYNCELAYYSIYRPVKEGKEASRDEAMAQMIKRISEDQQGAKVIVWAHNAHLAKAQIFGDPGSGGMAGMYLNEYFSGNYFVVGTGTAEGTCSSTTDHFIVNTSRFKSRPLFPAVPDSWESVMRAGNNTTWYIDTHDKQYDLPLLPLRFTGYRTSDKNDFMMSRLNQLFDGYIFIPVTQATTMQQ
ncbi:MAG: erythromycin esterase family protein [Niastella sp.]|nr:erythromycin esterase family protein [Niastella sp.]